MPRLPRLEAKGLPQHIIQRGNNRQLCFASEDDFVAYAGWLRKYAKKYEVDIHAWVFMSNHVHLLLTAHIDYGVSNLMQALGRQYVRYFNSQYKRTGTLWEGRFKSCLIQDERYLLECYRYIELNPVRAKMVEAPSEYKWSSHSTNAHGVRSSLLTPHPIYLSLGNSESERLRAYRLFFKGQVDPMLIDAIRLSTQKGLVIGNDIFKSQLEELHGRRVDNLTLGRPSSK